MAIQPFDVMLSNRSGGAARNAANDLELLV